MLEALPEAEGRALSGWRAEVVEGLGAALVALGAGLPAFLTGLYKGLRPRFLATGSEPLLRQLERLTDLVAPPPALQDAKEPVPKTDASLESEMESALGQASASFDVTLQDGKATVSFTGSLRLGLLFERPHSQGPFRKREFYARVGPSGGEAAPRRPRPSPPD